MSGPVEPPPDAERPGRHTRATTDESASKRPSREISGRCVCSACCERWSPIRLLGYHEVYGTGRPRRHLVVIK